MNTEPKQQYKMTARHVFRTLCLLLPAMLAWCACQQEDYSIPAPLGNGGEGLSLMFSSDPMQQYNVTTRSSDAKEDEEKTIHQLYIFFFDQNGYWLTGTYLEGYEDATGAIEQGGYIAPGEGATLIKIANESQHFNDYSAAQTATVYAVANVESSLFRELDGNGRPQCLQDIIDASNGIITTPQQALESISYQPSTLIFTSLPGTGMPMVGSISLDLTGTTGTAGERIIQLKALMARIDLNLSLESDITDHNLPSMLLTRWTARNLPVGASFTPTATGGTTALTDETKTDREVEGTQLIYNRQGEISLSFYMFENMQQPIGSANYPDSIKDYQQQRYKPTIASENATCVELQSEYTTYNNATCTVRYTLYLGSNHTNNFEVQRNHQYKNNIVIKGLLAHDTNDPASEGGEYTYDARVNIEEQDNLYYISILRERNHDAHFCVTPMDVYLFASETSNPTMTVTFLNNTDLDNEGNPWIRMEKIPAANMAAGSLPDGMTVSDHLIAGGNYTAGHGKRRYFTTDLVTNTLAQSGANITIDATRDRIYFYIDENLSDSQDRTAVVQLAYQDNSGATSTRTLEITQTHFIRIDIEEVYNESEMSGTWLTAELTFYRNHPIYMEVYEEYLDHYDPLDKYTTTTIYTGLPWEELGYNIIGLDNVESRYWFDRIHYNPIWGDDYEESNHATTNTEPSHNWYQGLEFTNQIITASGQTVMDLNGKPRSAAEYCYNKNKRESDGSVTNAKFFLPGIRQMERALRAQYNTFLEFQSYYYWSSSVGEREGRTSGVNNERARATKIKADGNYEQSGGAYEDHEWWEEEVLMYAYELGKGGYARRSEILRIRAFRDDLESSTE